MWAGAQGDVSAVLERRLKAALLYRMVAYVDFPEALFPKADTPFTIGIAGADSLAAELSEFATGRTVLNRPLAVRAVRTPEAARDVHLMFIGRAEQAQLGTLLRAAPPTALIVTESDDALRQGSVINFLIIDGQVRFEVSLEAARKRSLRLSARLLSVAHSIQPALP